MFLGKKTLILLSAFCGMVFLSGCSKDLTQSVEQVQTKIEIGSDVNLNDLFKCKEGISLGFKNVDAFNPNKVGSYSLDTTITDGENQVDKSYIIDVYDDVAPDIEASDITIYENDNVDLLKNVNVSDNSGENIEATITDQNVDANKPGNYYARFTAKDSSGNEAEKQINVTVKHKLTFSELKKISKKIVKEKSLNYLKVSSDSDKGVVWIMVKDFVGVVNKDSFISATIPGWALMVEENKTSYSILVNTAIRDKKNYQQPKHAYIRSDIDSIEADDYNINYDCDFNNTYMFYSELSFLFTDKGKIEKSINILNGDKLEIKLITNKYVIHSKLKNKDEKMVKQLVNFYNELQKITS